MANQLSELANFVAHLPVKLAGNAVAHGLPWESALEAITSAPADIFGVGATHGRIAVGQAADLVLWSGDPLELSTLADRVWIAGRPIARARVSGCCLLGG